MLIPCLAVLPMGWSWSLALCQSVLEAAIEEAGFSREQLIQDQTAGRVVSPGVDGVCGYVDNFGVSSTSLESSLQGVNRTSAFLRGKGLRVHDAEGATSLSSQTIVDFIGLSFGFECRLSIKPSRLWKLKQAIDELSSRKSISGAALERLMGQRLQLREQRHSWIRVGWHHGALRCGSYIMAGISGTSREHRTASS